MDPMTSKNAVVPFSSNKRPRMSSSPCTVSDIMGILSDWMKEVGDRDIASILELVAMRWTDSCMPPPSNLAKPEYLALVSLFARQDTMNPSAMRLFHAQMHLNAVKPCLFGTRIADRIAKDNAGLIRLVLGKFRDIAK